MIKMLATSELYDQWLQSLPDIGPSLSWHPIVETSPILILHRYSCVVILPEHSFLGSLSLVGHICPFMAGSVSGGLVISVAFGTNSSDQTIQNLMSQSYALDDRSDSNTLYLLLQRRSSAATQVGCTIPHVRDYLELKLPLD